ncbi:hypothetical protein NIES3275_42840 [Microchaete diplosiphon NIES-3275]|nr:hypothetical protein NIES3275_42840 [Microchaete diplosiphon NIES-3275]
MGKGEFNPFPLFPLPLNQTVLEDSYAGAITGQKCKNCLTFEYISFNNLVHATFCYGANGQERIGTSC